MLALVTGASSGIGEAIARELARRGHDLILVARRHDRLAKLADSLRQRYGVVAHPIPADLSLPGAAIALYEQVKERGLSVDILVNSAGLGQNGLFHRLGTQTMSQTMLVNIIALTELTRAFLPSMIGRQRGYILNLGSIASFVPGPRMAVYHASKAYVRALSEALWYELRDSGVSMTLLCPGPTASEFARRAKMDDTPAFTVMPVLQPAQVARAGVAAMLRGARVVIPGKINKILVASSFLTPRLASSRMLYWTNSHIKPDARRLPGKMIARLI